MSIVSPISSPIRAPTGQGSVLSISGLPVTIGYTNIAYAGSTFTANGGVPPYTFSSVGTPLPAGLSLNSSTGAITGTPTGTGVTAGHVIRVTDALSAVANSPAFGLTIGQKSLLSCSNNNPFTVSSQSVYFAWNGASNLTNNLPTPVATVWRGPNATIRGLMARVAVNTRVSATTVNFYKVGSSPVVTVTIPAGSTADATQAQALTDTLVSGDAYCVEVVLGAGGGNLVLGLSCECDIVGQAFVQLGQSASSAVAAGVTNFIAPGGSSGATATESNRQFPAPEAATDDRLQVYVTANTLSGSCTFTHRLNGVSQALTLTVPAGQTGFFEDASNSVAIAADDLVAIQVAAAAGTGSITFVLVSMRRTGSVANQVSVYSAMGNNGVTTTARIQGLSGPTTTAAVDADAQVMMPYAVNLSRLTARVVANTTVTSNTNVLSRINGVSGLQVAPILPASTALAKDTTNTDVVAALDKVCIRCAAPPNNNLTWQSFSMLVTGR